MQKVKRQDIHQDYDFVETISEGVYCQVIRAIHRDHDRAVIVKRIHKSKLPAEQLKRLHEQYEHLQKLDHPNLINIIEAYEDANSFYLIMEQLTGGDLLDWLNDLPDKNQATVCNTIRILADVIEYCHEHGAVLGNLKPQNIMMAMEHGNSVLKVLDFGMSKLIGVPLVTSVNGSSEFQAPQIIAGRPINQAVDFWSLGALMYLLLCGKPAFKGQEVEIRKKILKGDVDFPEEDWKYISSAAQDLVVHLLDTDPKTRYDANRIRNHPWMSSNFKRQHPQLSFNLRRYNADRRLQKMQQMVKLVLSLTLEKAQSH